MANRQRQGYKRYLEPDLMEAIPPSSYYRSKKQRLQRNVVYSQSAGPSEINSTMEIDAPAAVSETVHASGTGEDMPINIVEPSQTILCDAAVLQDSPLRTAAAVQSLAEYIDVLDLKSTNMAEEPQQDISDYILADINDGRSFMQAIDCNYPGKDGSMEDNAPLASFTSLQNAINNEAFNKMVDRPVDKTVGEIVLMLLKYALVHALSLTQVEDLFKMINCMFAEPFLCGTRHLIDKFFYPRGCVKLYAMCSDCGAGLGKFQHEDSTLQCHVCYANINVKDYNFKDFFVMMDVASPISKLIESNSEYYFDTVNRRVHREGLLSDIYDGNKYREFLAKLNPIDRAQYATLTFNTDGAPLFESSTYSIWPIFCMLNEVPFDIRSKDLILAGLWFGKAKPNMTVFLEPFVDDINELSVKGVECTIRGNPVNVKIFALVCCVDAVARAPVQGFNQFNGAYGCGQCLHPGKWVLSNAANPRSGNIKYPLLHEHVPKLRDSNETVEHMKQAAVLNKPVFGVKSASPLINLFHYNIIDGCIVDSLHCITGIAKQFATIWFGNSNKRGLLSRNMVKQVDARITSIKAPHQVARLTRSLSEKEFWKAREWENWTIFYSLVVLKGILPDNLLSHWGSFAEAIYILSKEKLTMAEVNRADRMLHEFVGRTEILYSRVAMTFNVHSLLHLAKSVSDWGPLWCHNAYAFESGNGNLLKVIHAAKGVHHQICRQINLKYSFLTMRDHILPDASFVVKNFCDTIGTTTAKHTFRIDAIRYFGAVSKVDESWIRRLNLQNNSVSYSKIVKDGCLYMSSTKDNNRSDNSFAMLFDNTYARLHHFLVDCTNRKEYTIVTKLHTTNVFDNGCDMLKKIENTYDEQSAISSNKIAKVCVHIATNNNNFLVAAPNLKYY